MLVKSGLLREAEALQRKILHSLEISKVFFSVVITKKLFSRLYCVCLGYISQILSIFWSKKAQYML